MAQRFSLREGLRQWLPELKPQTGGKSVAPVRCALNADGCRKDGCSCRLMPDVEYIEAVGEHQPAIFILRCCARRAAVKAAEQDLELVFLSRRWGGFSRAYLLYVCECWLGQCTETRWLAVVVLGGRHKYESLGTSG